MQIDRRTFLKLSGLAAVGAGIGGAVGLGLSQTILWHNNRPSYPPGQAAAMHVLNRVTWGPRPEDLARIQQLGIERYIDWQLQSERIPDQAVEAFLQRQVVLSMSPQRLAKLIETDYQQPLETMLWARVVRASQSERQFFERVVEFWTDHFNIPIQDQPAEKIVDDREVIRRHALGRFRDLVGASAQSPAMLIYLNNASNLKEHPNENYARELLELHTLGVNGGYSEQDVKEVARAFTGWTLQYQPAPHFVFDEESHDPGEKTVLGQRLPAGRGIEDGQQVLDLLASHPATARFLSAKLCRRFVSDDPPTSLVDSAAKRFQTTGGDIRQVLRHILTSAEFLASTGQKLRRPLEYTVALLRVLRPELKNPVLLNDWLYLLGHLPYHWPPPNGYPDVTRAWLNTNGLIQRWNAALMLTDPDYRQENGIQIDLDRLVLPAETAGELVDNATQRVLGGGIATPDREQLIAFVSEGRGARASVDPAVKDRLPRLIGLLLASPYFQWH